MPIITPMLTKLHPHINPCWHGPPLSLLLKSQPTCFACIFNDAHCNLSFSTNQTNARAPPVPTTTTAWMTSTATHATAPWDGPAGIAMRTSTSAKLIHARTTPLALTWCPDITVRAVSAGRARAVRLT